MIMFAQERQQIISNMLKEKSSIKVIEISEALNVSESTIRRDLQEMEEKSLLMRTHGGAVGVGNRTNYEPSFLDKKDERKDKKIKIAECASKMIKDGYTVILDSGTTILEIAKRITAKDVTIVTNSIDIAGELSSNDQIEVIVTGGSIRVSTRAMVGTITERMLKNFRVDKAFIGANGISIDDGVTTPNVTEAQTKKVMMNNAREVIVVADGSKFRNVSFSVICPVKAVSMIITSDEITEQEVQEYNEVGVEVITT